MPVASLAQVALFLHLVGAFLLVGGTVVAGVAFETARARRRAGEIGLLLGAARAGVALVAVGSALVLAFGLWLVHLDHVGFGAGWVDAAIALFLAAGALGGVAGRAPKQARLLAQRLPFEQDATLEVRALLDDSWGRALNYAAGLLLVAVLALMVFRPG